MTTTTLTRNPVLWTAVLAAALAFGGCGGSSKHAIDDPCANNSDCADNICHQGICAASSTHALANGSPCTGDGECLSFNCQALDTARVCAPGTATDSTACIRPEECASGACTNGACGTGAQQDAGAVDTGCLVTCTGDVTSGCTCSATCNGHTYALACTGGTCTCDTDGKPTGTASGDFGSCAITDSMVASAWTSASPRGCGFPAPVPAT